MRRDPPQRDEKYQTQIGISVALWRNSSHLILIDSGASAHIFKDKSYFTSFDRNFDPNSVCVILADGTVCNNITAKGTIRITLNTSKGAKKQVTLDNVYLMPTLNHKGIISVRSGIKQGHAYNFGPDNSYVSIEGDKCPFNSSGDNDLFYININSTNLKSTVARSASQWHAIMGHLNFEDLLKTQKFVDGMTINNVKSGICNPCVLNKAKWVVSKRPGGKGFRPMESIHFDIAMPGGYKGPAYNDFKYLVNFVDDHSGYMYCIPLLCKADLADALEKYLLFSQQFGSVKTLRSDQALENESGSVEEICRAWGIQHDFSGAYAPPQNGTVERSIGTLHTRARCMLNTTHLGHFFWPFAYQYAAEVYNRSYIRRIKDTPYNLVHRRKPDNSILRRFGSTVYAPIPKQLRSCKLGERAVKGPFVGLDKKDRGYLIYNQETSTAKSWPYLVSHTQAPDQYPMGETEEPPSVSGNDTQHQSQTQADEVADQSGVGLTRMAKHGGKTQTEQDHADQSGVGLTRMAKHGGKTQAGQVLADQSGLSQSRMATNGGGQNGHTRRPRGRPRGRTVTHDHHTAGSSATPDHTQDHDQGGGVTIPRPRWPPI